MKKAVLITGIIWAIAMGVSMLIFGILSIIYVAAANSPEAIAQAAQAAKVTEEEAKALSVRILNAMSRLTSPPPQSFAPSP